MRNAIAIRGFNLDPEFKPMKDHSFCGLLGNTHDPEFIYPYQLYPLDKYNITLQFEPIERNLSVEIVSLKTKKKFTAEISTWFNFEFWRWLVENHGIIHERLAQKIPRRIQPLALRHHPLLHVQKPK